MELIFRIFTAVSALLIAFGAYVSRADSTVLIAPQSALAPQIFNKKSKNSFKLRFNTNEARKIDNQPKSIRQPWVESRPYSL